MPIALGPVCNVVIPLSQREVRMVGSGACVRPIFLGANFVNSRMGIGFAGDYAVQLWSAPDCSSTPAALNSLQRKPLG